MNNQPVTLVITFYPDDIQDIKDILAEGKSSGILEHILGQYESATIKGADNA